MIPKSKLIVFKTVSKKTELKLTELKLKITFKNLYLKKRTVTNGTETGINCSKFASKKGLKSTETEITETELKLIITKF